jgi:hypothetical protein
MRAFMRYLTLLVLASVVLAACGSLPKTGATPEATLEATGEPAPRAEGGSPHIWEAQPVLVTLYNGPGYTDEGYAWSLTVLDCDGARGAGGAETGRSASKADRQLVGLERKARAG